MVADNTELVAEMRSVADIKPYWRNPRRISDEAVNALSQSITSYGFQQPIVLDTEGVIIAGHTRYAASRRLGLTEVPVVIAKSLTPKQAKELRTIDNRTGEYTRWDYDKLIEELEGMDARLVGAFFPEVSQRAVDEVLDTPEPEVDEGPPEEVGSRAAFICPSCFHGWEQDVSRSMVEKGMIRQ